MYVYLMISSVKTIDTKNKHAKHTTHAHHIVIQRQFSCMYLNIDIHGVVFLADMAHESTLRFKESEQ